MTTFLKQSTAVTIRLGPFVDSTDGFTAETGLTISQADVRLSKNHGAFAQKGDTSAATHEENGWYQVPLSTTDTGTLGRLLVAVNESGALPVWDDFIVVSANVYDSLVAGSDKLQTDVVEWLGTEPLALNSQRVQVRVGDMALGIITAGAIATGAIDADALAADAVAEIADGVWDEPRAGHTTADTFGDYLDDEVSSRAAPGDAMDLVAGAVDAAAIATDAIDADAIAANAIDASALAADAATEIATAVGAPSASAIADAVWDEAQSGHTSAGTFGKYLDTEVSGVGGGSAPTAAEIADAVWDEAKSGHTTPDTFGDYLDTEVSGVGGGSAPTAAGVADAVWDELKADHTVADSFGDYLDDEISSRATSGDVPTAGAVADAVWDESKADHTTPDTFGDYLDDEISSRAAAGDVPTAGAVADAVWDELKADHTVADSFGDYLDDEVSSRAAPGAEMDLVAGAVDAAAVADGAIDAGAVAAGAANKIADHTLRRSFANARGSADGDTLSFRSLLGAVAKLVNRWSISGTTLTVYREDDTTALGTQTLTPTAGVDPITQIDTD